LRFRAACPPWRFKKEGNTMKKEFVIYTKMLEVISWLFEKVNTFPKKQRFVLGQQILLQG
jgi:hypothetical protein